MERKLTAILSADVKGYSRLTLESPCIERGLFMESEELKMIKIHAE